MQWNSNGRRDIEPDIISVKHNAINKHGENKINVVGSLVSCEFIDYRLVVNLPIFY